MQERCKWKSRCGSSGVARCCLDLSSLNSNHAHIFLRLTEHFLGYGRSDSWSLQPLSFVRHVLASCNHLGFYLKRYESCRPDIEYHSCEAYINYQHCKRIDKNWGGTLRGAENFLKLVSLLPGDLEIADKNRVGCAQFAYYNTNSQRRSNGGDVIKATYCWTCGWDPRSFDYFWGSSDSKHVSLV